MSSNKRIQDFCYKYEATIQPSRKKWRRASRTKPSWEDNSIAYQLFDYEDIPLAEIHMPTDRLNALLDLEEFRTQLQKNLASPILSRHHRAYDMIMEYEEECRIRHTNPAVKKAYEHYQMLLNLSR